MVNNDAGGAHDAAQSKERSRDEVAPSPSAQKSTDASFLETETMSSGPSFGVTPSPAGDSPTTVHARSAAQRARAVMGPLLNNSASRGQVRTKTRLNDGRPLKRSRTSRGARGGGGLACGSHSHSASTPRPRRSVALREQSTRIIPEDPELAASQYAFVELPNDRWYSLLHDQSALLHEQCAFDQMASAAPQSCATVAAGVVSQRPSPQARLEASRLDSFDLEDFIGYQAREHSFSSHHMVQSSPPKGSGGCLQVPQQPVTCCRSVLGMGCAPKHASGSSRLVAPQIQAHVPQCEPAATRTASCPSLMLLPFATPGVALDLAFARRADAAGRRLVCM